MSEVWTVEEDYCRAFQSKKSYGAHVSMQLKCFATRVRFMSSCYSQKEQLEFMFLILTGIDP